MLTKSTSPHKLATECLSNPCRADFANANVFVHAFTKVGMCLRVCCSPCHHKASCLSNTVAEIHVCAPYVLATSTYTHTHQRTCCVYTYCFCNPNSQGPMPLHYVTGVQTPGPFTTTPGPYTQSTDSMPLHCHPTSHSKDAGE